MLSRFSIQQRLYSVPAIVTLLLLGMIGFMMYEVGGILENAKLVQTYRSLAFKGALVRGDLANLRKLEKDQFLNVRDRPRAVKYNGEWNEMHATFMENLQAMENLTPSEEDKQEIRKLTEEAREYKRGMDEYHTNLALKPNISPEDARSGFDPVRERVKNVIERSEKKVFEYEKKADDAQKDQERRVDVVVNSIIGITLVVLVTGVVLTLFIARSILKPLHLITERVEGVARGEGDLTLRIGLKSSDELGRLAAALDQFLESTSGVIRDVLVTLKAAVEVAVQLSEASQNLSAGSEEMSTQTQTIAAAASQLHQNLEVVSSSIEEMSISVGDIAKRSVDAASVAKDASMRTTTTNSVVSELGQNADQIGKVIESIVDIADQTNLLALNAAIEAADAGDTGKRFAVVAAEVKELARQTGESSEEIKTRIEAIQKSVELTVLSIGSITEVIEKINEVNGAIASFVEEQSIASQEVSRNATTAATVSTEVARNVASVSSVVSEGATEATRIAQLADKLNTMARRLEGDLGRFRV